MQEPSSFKVYNASAGSGKTFTLVKEYLKILFQTSDPKRFKQILAVTFTNKAAAEMKARVINNLRAFAKADILDHKTDMFKQLEEELSVSAIIIHQRAEKVLHNILQNYSAFNITTIDSFTYRLIRSFAFDLGLSLNFDVEMDAKSLLNEAIENLLSKLGEDEELTKLLIDFSIHKANEDKSWDISLELKEIAQILLNEADSAQVQKIQEKPIKDFLNLKNRLAQKQKTFEKQFVDIGNAGLSIINSMNIKYDAFSHGGELPKHFIKLKDKLIDKLIFDGRLDKNIIDNYHFYSGKTGIDEKKAIDSIINELKALYFKSKNLYQNHFEEYVLNGLFLKNLIPLAVLSSISKCLDDLKEEKNIRLNAEFNQLISKNLQEQPAAFIYERIGEKFKHYFIDEMQDTSGLQWQNLVPLIANALAQEHTSLLLVGDTKQAIYRWRGSEPEQFLKLSYAGDSKEHNPFNIPKEILSLGTNYRSYDQIINFNNSFFQYLSSFFNKPEYAEMYFSENQQEHNFKEGGYVQLSFVEQGLKGEDKDISYAERVLKIINNLNADFNKNEICVLTRTRKQGSFIADFLSDKGIDIISSETLLLKNSRKINFIINLLTYLRNGTDKEAKLNAIYAIYDQQKLAIEKHAFFKRLLHLKFDEFFDALKEYSIDFDFRIFIQFSLYDSVEYIIRSFHLNTNSDAYLQFFLDEVLNFSLKKEIDNSAFLEFWSDKKEELSIIVPEEKEAVRIMTIHKAKGLEFPVVIFPYDLDIYSERNPKAWVPTEQTAGFDALLVTNPRSLKRLEAAGEQGRAIYQSHRDEQELDSFNLLYVALTRAIEHLYVVAERKTTNDLPKTSSQFFIGYLQSIHQWDEQQTQFSFGSSERNAAKSTSPKQSIELKSLISSSWQSHHIAIVANASLLWDNKVGDSISYGNLIHQILAHIKTEDDIDETIATYISAGTLAVDQTKIIRDMLVEVVTHPDLCEYYQHNLKILNEREIMTETKEVIIPDRLIINKNNEAIIMDYKTGKPDKKYHQQLVNYGIAVEKLGYTVLKKLLVYLGETIIIEEV